MKFYRRLSVYKQLTLLGPPYPRYLSSSSSSKSGNYYDVLGVDRNSSRKDIRKAFLEKSKEYHPDSVSRSELSSDQLKSKFQEINEAYQVLNDPSERRNYDESMRHPSSGYSSNSNNWRQYGYGNYSDYQQYRAQQEFMRQQGNYWANYNRKFNEGQYEDLTWKSFFRWKMGQPMTVANFLLSIFILGVTIEVFHSIYIFRYISKVKRERAIFGPSWFETNKNWNEVKDKELLNRLEFIPYQEETPSTDPKSSPSLPPLPPPPIK